MEMVIIVQAAREKISCWIDDIGLTNEIVEI